MSNSKSNPINLLRYHRPKLRLNEARIPLLTQHSKQCLRNLSSYRCPKPRMVFPRSRCAAVLVALFVGRQGDLYVLLSRRSTTLRTYAGDTALPGGKVDPGDKTMEDTARREAYEEIGLPPDRQKIPLLCVLEPFLAGGQLIVTPVVVLILDNTLRPILNTPEVTSLFSHPLHSFLSSTPPFPSEPESLEVPYHSYVDVDWKGLGKVRMHRFLTGREAGGVKPVFGITAAILIQTAKIGYAQEPDFEFYAPGPDAASTSTEARIAWTMLHSPVFREAFVAEGIRRDDELMQSLADGEKANSKRRDPTDTGSRRRRVPRIRSKL